MSKVAELFESLDYGRSDKPHTVLFERSLRGI